jgi:biopolymer transport protein ExbB
MAGLALATLILAGGAGGAGGVSPDLDALAHSARLWAGRAAGWYRQTPPADRITWGGLAACAGLGLGVLLERLWALRPRRVVPRDFQARFLDRLDDGKLDRGRALDFCELNPSPAARVALAAVRRWGRPAADLERAAALTQRVEADRLRRNVGTLRRIAALTPLLGLLGTLVAAGRALAAQGAGGAAAAPPAWGTALADALSPLTAGVALAIMALVAYDGLIGRIEKLAGALDRLGAETVDAIALAAPLGSRAGDPKPGAGGAARTPHQLRVEIPDALTYPLDLDTDRD